VEEAVSVEILMNNTTLKTRKNDLLKVYKKLMIREIWDYEKIVEKRY